MFVFELVSFASYSNNIDPTSPTNNPNNCLVVNVKLKKIIPIINVFMGVTVVIIDANPLSISVWP